MGNDKKHVWKDYFESRIYGDYIKSHKDILRLVDKELMIKFPNEYPYIHFNWVDISDLYDKYRDEYYGQKSESKQTHNDGKYFMKGMLDGITDVMFSYHPAEIIFDTDPIPNLSFLHRSIDLDLIQWNKDKDCVFVKLMDGRSTIVKRYGDTKDDIYAAVAYALAKIEFETNSNFKKEVDSCLVILDSKKGKKNGK